MKNKKIKPKFTEQELELQKKLKAQFYIKNKALFFLSLATTVLLATGQLALSWLLQQVIDTTTGRTNDFTLLQLLLIAVAMCSAMILNFGLQYVSVPNFIKRAVRQYKDFAFNEIAKKNISAFAEENTAKYISALSNDVASIEINYVSKVFALIQYTIMFFGAFGMMLYFSPLLTLIALLLTILPVIGSVFTGSKMAEQEKNVSIRNEGFVGTVKDMLSGFSIIKSFKAEKESARLFNESNLKVEEAKRKKRQTEVIISTIGFTAGVFAQFGVFFAGAFLALAGHNISAGIIIIFVQLMGFVVQPISAIPPILANRKAAEALIAKLSTSLLGNIRAEEKKAENRASKHEANLLPKSKALKEGIVVKNLSFSYDNNFLALSNLNLQFQAGKSYAIVGGSGSGKSTLLNLLLASSSNYTGEIIYDYTELKSIDSSALFDLVSIVQQNVFVFNSSILENITMFKEFDKKNIEWAVKMSGLDAVLKERGMDYQCGENGNNLSGGEKQRISIARCLLRETPVILIDEATAALDAETAFAVTNSLLNIPNITKIVVTHRLDKNILKKFDKIFVLKKGELVEAGTFTELIDNKELFYSLYTVSQ